MRIEDFTSARALALPLLLLLAAGCGSPEREPVRVVITPHGERLEVGKDPAMHDLEDPTAPFAEELSDWLKRRKERWESTPTTAEQAVIDDLIGLSDARLAELQTALVRETTLRRKAALNRDVYWPSLELREERLRFCDDFQADFARAQMRKQEDALRREVSLALSEAAKAYPSLASPAPRALVVEACLRRPQLARRILAAPDQIHEALPWSDSGFLSDQRIAVSREDIWPLQALRLANTGAFGEEAQRALDRVSELSTKAPFVEDGSNGRANSAKAVFQEADKAVRAQLPALEADWRMYTDMQRRTKAELVASKGDPSTNRRLEQSWTEQGTKRKQCEARGCEVALRALAAGLVAWVEAVINQGNR